MLLGGVLTVEKNFMLKLLVKGLVRRLRVVWSIVGRLVPELWCGHRGLTLSYYPIGWKVGHYHYRKRSMLKLQVFSVAAISFLVSGNQDAMYDAKYGKS